jgi:transposase
MADIRIPLDLPNVEVVSIEKHAPSGWTITVESTLLGTHCRKCGQWIQEFHEHDTWVEIQHLSILDQPVFIRYRPKRYRSTVQDVSQKEGAGYDAVLGVLERRVQVTVDWSRFGRLEVIGIDELALKKGQRDYAVLVSARLAEQELALLAVLPDRQKETVQAFLNSIPDRLKATIHTVCVICTRVICKRRKMPCPGQRLSWTAFMWSSSMQTPWIKPVARPCWPSRKHCPRRNFGPSRAVMWSSANTAPT